MADRMRYRLDRDVIAEELEEPYSAYGSRGLVQGTPGQFLCYVEGYEQDKYVVERDQFQATYTEQGPFEEEGASTAEFTLAEQQQAEGMQPAPPEPRTDEGEPFETGEPPQDVITPEGGETAGPAVTEGPLSTASIGTETEEPAPEQGR